jgi:hypothetical protein
MGEESVKESEIFRVIRQIDAQICNKCTGAPDILAGSLKMSTRLLFYYLDVMKILGAPIDYSKEDDTYIYKREGSFGDAITWTALETMRNY